MSTATAKLFQPVRLGELTLGHRVAMAPMTRTRAVKGVPLPIVREYYTQRASTPGTFIITEGKHKWVGLPTGELIFLAGTLISQKGGVYEANTEHAGTVGRVGAGSPGIFTDAQISSWRQVCDPYLSPQHQCSSLTEIGDHRGHSCKGMFHLLPAFCHGQICYSS
jgi:NADPH2 dehydrogenase